MRQRNLARTAICEKSNKPLRWIAASLLVGAIFGFNIAGNKENDNYTEAPSAETALLSDNIQLCFTPDEKCTPLILKEIALAKDTIYVQAYGMSSPPIVEALVDAHKRGVKVNILLDKSNLNDSWSKMQELVDAGIEVNIDKLPGIAHNKVIIIDLQKIITGSFNFTRSADTRNAENVIVIDDKVIADRYVKNWLLRWVVATWQNQVARRSQL